MAYRRQENGYFARDRRLGDAIDARVTSLTEKFLIEFIWDETLGGPVKVVWRSFTDDELVSRARGVSRNAIHTALNRMMSPELGWISRRPDPADRRRWQYRVHTDKFGCGPEWTSPCRPRADREQETPVTADESAKSTWQKLQADCAYACECPYLLKKFKNLTSSSTEEPGGSKGSEGTDLLHDSPSGHGNHHPRRNCCLLPHVGSAEGGVARTDEQDGRDDHAGIRRAASLEKAAEEGREEKVGDPAPAAGRVRKAAVSADVAHNPENGRTASTGRPDTPRERLRVRGDRNKRSAAPKPHNADLGPDAAVSAGRGESGADARNAVSCPAMVVEAVLRVTGLADQDILDSIWRECANATLTADEVVWLVGTLAPRMRNAQSSPPGYLRQIIRPHLKTPARLHAAYAQRLPAEADRERKMLMDLLNDPDYPAEEKQALRARYAYLLDESPPKT